MQAMVYCSIPPMRGRSRKQAPGRKEQQLRTGSDKGCLFEVYNRLQIQLVCNKQANQRSR